jgi:integrase
MSANSSAAPAKPRNLTKRMVDALKPGEMVWDGIVLGFGARCRSEGRLFYVKYRAGKGRRARQRWYKIGRHGSVTVEEARAEARRILGDVAHGKDPAALRDAAKIATTVDAFADRYLAEHAEARKKPSSVRMDRQNLARHIRPALGRLTLVSVTRADIAKFVHDRRKTPGAANRCLALLSKMFNLAEAWGVRPDGSNPCRHVERFPAKPRDRFLSQDELGRLGAALAEHEKTGGPAVYLAALVRLLIFTGARLGEIRTARWEWIDLRMGELRLPDSKTGAKTVHLPAPAIAVLTALPRIDGNPHVIAGIGTEPLKHVWQPWWAVRAKALLPDLRLHDLRHSFASIGAAAGLSLRMIGGLLGHAHASTTQRYAHLAADPLKSAADRISSAIEAALASKPGGEVVELQDRGQRRVDG